jgi:hypothetical protein
MLGGMAERERKVAVCGFSETMRSAVSLPRLFLAWLLLPSSQRIVTQGNSKLFLFYFHGDRITFWNFAPDAA